MTKIPHEKMVLLNYVCLLLNTIEKFMSTCNVVWVSCGIVMEPLKYVLNFCHNRLYLRNYTLMNSLN